MRHLDLFSGIGGFALACTWVWGKDYVNVGHSEIEEYPCKVYHRHFPGSPCLGDITKIKWQEGRADLITGGFPCQPHSVAGKRKASQDDRDLWGECVRAVRGVRPRYALFENVPGLLVSERGRFFNRVLTDLAESGYAVEYRILSAQSQGAPHKRERVWIVAYAEQTCNYINVEEWHTQSKRRTAEDIRGTHWKQFELVVSEVAPIEWRMSGFELVPKSFLVRRDNGIPSILDRLGTLGNAIVPQCAAVILQAIKDYDEVYQ